VKLTHLFKRTPPAPMNTGRRIFFTAGDQLLAPERLRGAFEQALARSLTSTGSVSDESAARAYAVAITAYICTEYRADKTGAIPLRVIDRAGQVLNNTPLDYGVSQLPSVMADWQRSHLIWGRTYLRKRYNARGYPTGLKWLNPLDVYEYTRQSEVIGYRLTLANGTWEDVSLREIIYTQGFDPQPGGNGLSKFEAAWLSLNIEQAAATQAAAFFVNGARLDGFLSSDKALTPDQEDDLRKAWAESYKGANKAHKTAYLPGGIKYNKMSSPPKDLAMGELRAIAREDVCGVFSVDPILVGLKGTADPLSANSTYGTTETAHIRGVALPFVQTVILPALNEQWVSEFAGDYVLEVNENAIPALVEAQLTKAATSVSLAGATVLDYTEARRLIGHDPRPEYLIRKPDEALALWQASGITLNVLHQLTMGQTPLGVNGDVFLLGGQLVPASRLLELANATVDLLKAPAAPPLPLPSTPVQVAPPSAPQLPGRAGDTSLCAMLTFPHHPDLIGLQQRLQVTFNEQAVRWLDPSEFHMTLLFAPDANSYQAQQMVRALETFDLPDLSLRVGSLHSFDSVGEHALHFRIRLNEDLLDLQETLYELALAQTVGVSAYSVPNAYTPHVTMGYLSTRPRAVTFQSKLALHPTSIKLLHGDQVIYERPFNSIQSLPVARSSDPLVLGFDLTENTFVRYSQRILADALNQRGINAEWVVTGWQLPLAQAAGYTRGQLSTLLKTVDYATLDRQDARLIGFDQRGQALYLRVDTPLDLWQRTAELDLTDAGMTATPGAGAILLGSCAETVTDFPAVDFPIVLNSLSVYAGSEIFYSWTLRSASGAQTRELKNREIIVRRKGWDHPFRYEALPQLVRDLLQVAAGEDVDAAFADAGLMLTRSYGSTRAEFQIEVARLITAANADETSRRAFAGALRAALRRSGLMAFRDGMESGGYSPESFSPDEITLFRAWLAESSDYVTNLGDSLFKQGDTPDSEFRSELWANKSLDDIYYAGLRIGAPDQLATWKLGGTIDHCDSCATRNGQSATIDAWGKVGFPRDRRLDCGGWRCDCDLFDAQGRRIGAR
jgi:HK97 family phage portal protein